MRREREHFWFLIKNVSVICKSVLQEDFPSTCIAPTQGGMKCQIRENKLKNLQIFQTVEIS